MWQHARVVAGVRDAARLRPGALSPAVVEVGAAAVSPGVGRAVGAARAARRAAELHDGGAATQRSTPALCGQVLLYVPRF